MLLSSTNSSLKHYTIICRMIHGSQYFFQMSHNIYPALPIKISNEGFTSVGGRHIHPLRVYHHVQNDLWNSVMEFISNDLRKRGNCVPTKEYLV